MKILKTLKLAGVVGATGVLAAVVLGGSPALASPEFSLSSEELVPELATAQQASDLPSEAVLDGPTGDTIIESSIRQLASSDFAEYYVADGADSNQICLVIVEEAAGVSASACIDRKDFYTKGLSLGVTGEEKFPELATNAYLLPPDVQETSGAQKNSSARGVADSSVVTESPQIIVVPQNEAQPTPSDYVRYDGKTPFTLVPLVGNE